MEIAICDDQAETRVEIQQIISEYMEERNEKYKLTLYETGTALLEADHFYDIIFMDIELEHDNGLQIISQYQYRKDSKVIFVTSHMEEMQNGYHVRAFRFLLKPLQREQFYEAVTAACREISEDGRLLVSDGEHEYRIRFSEIYYIEAATRSVCIRTENADYTYGVNIENMKDILKGPQFYQTHRSYIVNMDYIDRIQNNEIIMLNGERVKISMLKAKEFNDKVFFTHIRRRADGY